MYRLVGGVRSKQIGWRPYSGPQPICWQQNAGARPSRIRLALPNGRHRALAAAALHPVSCRARVPVARSRWPHPHRHWPSRVRAGDRRRDPAERVPARGPAATGADAFPRRSHRGRGRHRRSGRGEVLAHHADAPFIRAGAAGPAPDLADWERPIYQQVMSQRPAEPLTPPRIDHEIEDGDELGFGDGAVAVAVPGHTPGSIALYLPRHRVLFTGDAAARSPDGKVICGIFNVNRAQAAASLRRLAYLDATIACFGHGEPLTRDAAAEMQASRPGVSPVCAFEGARQPRVPGLQPRRRQHPRQRAFRRSPQSHRLGNPGSSGRDAEAGGELSRAALTATVCQTQRTAGTVLNVSKFIRTVSVGGGAGRRSSGRRRGQPPAYR
jgi:Metallo-beta-lactamase superfamily